MASRLLAVTVASLALLVSGTASAQFLVYDDGGTHILNTSVDGVTVEGTGTQLFVSDGAFAFDLSGADTSSVSMLGGHLVHASLIDAAQFEMSGGQVEGDFSFYGTSSGLIAGGMTGLEDQVEVGGNASLEVTGGAIGNIGGLQLYGEGFASLTGGTMSTSLFLYEDSHAVLDGLTGALSAQAWGSSLLEVLDDAPGTLLAGDSGTISTRGGSPGTLRAQGTGTILVYGSGFEVDGFAVPDGPLAALSGSLTGTLENGDPLSASFQQGGGSYTGSIVLVSVPEPATGSLLALALAATIAGTRPRHRASR